MIINLYYYPTICLNNKSIISTENIQQVKEIYEGSSGNAIE